MERDCTSGGSRILPGGAGPGMKSFPAGLGGASDGVQWRMLSVELPFLHRQLNEGGVEARSITDRPSRTNQLRPTREILSHPAVFRSATMSSCNSVKRPPETTYWGSLLKTAADLPKVERSAVFASSLMTRMERPLLNVRPNAFEPSEEASCNASARGMSRRSCTRGYLVVPVRGRASRTKKPCVPEKRSRLGATLIGTRSASSRRPGNHFTPHIWSFRSLRPGAAVAVNRRQKRRIKVRHGAPDSVSIAHTFGSTCAEGATKYTTSE